ncbi:MAG: DNA polymerase III subunit alpha, partial [Chitinophagaceae bacterium]
LGGIKGVGEAAIENIVDVRTKKGAFENIFDLVKRVNLRSVNKKSMECLVYSGAFDCFKDMHRAQYFFSTPGEQNALEKIIKYGAICQSQSSSSANTLFGDMQSIEIAPPKLLQCAPWQLVEQLDHEKNVVGMYISGHPLDNFKFELRHYQIIPVETFNETKNAVAEGNVPSYTFRMAGLVTDAQQRLTKTGKPFAILTIEDYSGKTEFWLFGEDFIKFQPYLKTGIIIMVEGSYYARFKNAKVEFKISRMHLLETVKSSLTRQIVIDLPIETLDQPFVDFMTRNFDDYPGNTTVKLYVSSKDRDRTSILSTLERGITMNDELAYYLENHPGLEVKVQLN